MPFLLLLVERSLPRDLPRPAPPSTRLALVNLCVLVGSVLAVSVGSSAPAAAANAAGLAVALAGLMLFVRLEARRRRLLPHGACNPATALGAAYATMMMLIIGVSTEIFVPYFLQVLHGMTPLHAGYLSALMSAGWSIGAVGGSSQSIGGTRALLTAGPLLLAGMLAGMFLLVPRPGVLGDAQLWVIGAFLLGQGLGIERRMAASLRQGVRLCTGLREGPGGDLDHHCHHGCQRARIRARRNGNERRRNDQPGRPGRRSASGGVAVRAVYAGATAGISDSAPVVGVSVARGAGALN